MALTMSLNNCFAMPHNQARELSNLHGIKPHMSSDIQSDILPGIPADILFGMYSDIISGILSGICS